jgi:hypothetical protein
MLLIYHFKFLQALEDAFNGMEERTCNKAEAIQGRIYIGSGLFPSEKILYTNVLVIMYIFRKK